ncbi:hypothetical protein SAMN05216319_1951 [Duganella sp. CF402]|uniref:hypothetical protein n=1 Tax=unclassified Duganella TaxID=2636909 RepID=UPI0008CA8F59|nr:MULTISPECIES: hypothetical protein [unclassified Duganella]RZT09619.1 hypothetical protein EV582_1672 [Duganella sp. BK701]SEL49807.1 hypothetical protein SAMN05216319_1951 [Duganella sp. CF402]
MNANSDREYIDNKVGDVRTAVDDLRVTMNERFDALRMTMDARFKATDAKIDSAVAKGTAEVIKWVVGLFVTTIALNVALASVVLHVALREPPPPPAPSPAAATVQPIYTPSVIIQLSPQGAAVLPAAPAGGKP